MVVVVLVAVAVAVVVVEGPRSARSSMKLPVARLEGVRGRCRVRVME